MSGPLVRFGTGALADAGDIARELGLERLLLVTSFRGAALADRLPVAGVFDGVRRQVPSATVAEAGERARELEAGGLLALGGGSAMDTAKAVSVGLGLPVLAVPTTYAGAEWTPYFGVRDEERRRKGGGSGATVAAVVYDPELTLDLPPAETGGTALNALAHCAEALYARGRGERAERHALAGARAIAYALPLVLAEPRGVYGRTRLLEGAMRAGRALAEGGLALGHAMAQALGGRYGLPHGALNAVCLPAALRFNAPVAGEQLARLAQAMSAEDAAAGAEELARLAGFSRLRDLGVPEDELGTVAEDVLARPGTRANPRPVTRDDAEELLRGVW